MKLLKEQFERLGRNPDDLRLLKQLSVEFGSLAHRCNKPEEMREFRIIVASVLRNFEEKELTVKMSYVSGALCAILDAAAAVDECLMMEDFEKEEVIIIDAADQFVKEKTS